MNRNLQIIGLAILGIAIVKSRRPDGTIDFSNVIGNVFSLFTGPKPAPAVAGNGSGDPTVPASHDYTILEPPAHLEFPKDPSVGESNLPNMGDPNNWYQQEELLAVDVALWQPAGDNDAGLINGGIF